MPNYTIQDQAIQLSGLYSEPYQIRNSGNATVYLGKDTSVSNAQYDWSLNPGDTLGFTAQTYLYLICAPGESSTLEQQYGALGNFTPGPSDVLARLSNDLTLLDTETFPVSPLGISGGGTLRTIDVHKYASVLITINTASTTHTGFVGTPSNYIYMALSMLNESGIVTADANSYFLPQWLLADTQQSFVGGFRVQSIQVPTTGVYVSVFTEYIKAATAVGGTITTKIYGSNEQISTARYVSRGLGMQGDLDTTGFFGRTNTPNLTTQYTLTSRNVPTVAVMRRVSGTNAHMDVVALDAGTPKIVYAFNPDSEIIFKSVSASFNAPMLPLRLTTTNTSSSSDISVLQ